MQKCAEGRVFPFRYVENLDPEVPNAPANKFWDMPLAATASRREAITARVSGSIGRSMREA